MGEVFGGRDRGGARPDLRVLVYGAGAVGAWLAARVALTGAETTLYGRPAAIASLRANGLAFESGGRTFVSFARFADSLALPGPAPDYVLLAVKSFHIPAALPDLVRLAGAGAMVVTMQNGVGAEEAVAAAVGAARVIAGVTTVSVSTPEPGLVAQHTEEGGVAFAPLPDGPTPGTLLSLFDEAGIPAVGFASHRDLKWSKLLLNMLANAQAAILDTDAATVAGDPALFALERRAFRETLAVMRRLPAQPVPLPGYDVPKLALAMQLPAPVAWRLLRGRIGGGRGEKRPSLALALAAGARETEADALNGAVARAARAHGLRAPANETLAALVAQLAARPDTAPPPAARRDWLRNALWARGVRG